MYAIEVSNLKKSYGKVQALKGGSFQVKKGSITAILGSNGQCFQTRFLRRLCISTAMRPDFSPPSTAAAKAASCPAFAAAAMPPG